MKDPLNRIRFGKQTEAQTEYVISVSIYEEYLYLFLQVPIEVMADAIFYGGVDSERALYHSTLKKIFNNPFEGLVIFYSEDDAKNWGEKQTFKIPDVSNGRWSMVAIITLDQANFEKSLENALVYIKNSYDDFIDPRRNLKKVAQDVINKISTK